MKPSIKHKFLGVLLAGLVLFPFTVQAFHAMESHEHQVCSAKDVKHFHAQDLDCSIFHVPVKNQSDGAHFEYEIFINKSFVQKFYGYEITSSLGYSSLKSSRAPPFFIV